MGFHRGGQEGALVAPAPPPWPGKININDRVNDFFQEKWYLFGAI